MSPHAAIVARVAAQIQQQIDEDRAHGAGADVRTAVVLDWSEGLLFIEAARTLAEADEAAVPAVNAALNAPSPSRQRVVYAVEADKQYETSNVVRIFAARADADAFAAKCRRWDDEEPAFPAPDDSDYEWDKWTREHTQWAKRHPARPYVKRDYFVTSVPFVRKTTK